MARSTGPTGWPKRAALAAIGGFAVASALGACTSGAVNADEKEPVVIYSYQRGFSVMLTEWVDENQSEGDNIVIKNSNDIQQVYTDFMSGEADMTIGGPDVFARQAAQGSPVHVAATVSPNSTAAVGKTKIETAKDLEGKRVAASTTTGGWLLIEARFEEEFGLEAEKDYELIAVQDMASGTNQVIAGTADFAVGWEPSVNQALEKSDELMISYSASNAKEGETYGEGWQLVLGTRNDVPPERVADVVRLLEAGAEALTQDPEMTDEYAQRFDFEPGVAAGAMGQSVPAYLVKPAGEQELAEIRRQIELVLDESELPPESFYKGSSDGDK